MSLHPKYSCSAYATSRGGHRWELLRRNPGELSAASILGHGMTEAEARACEAVLNELDRASAREPDMTPEQIARGGLLCIVQLLPDLVAIIKGLSEVQSTLSSGSSASPSGSTSASPPNVVDVLPMSHQTHPDDAIRYLRPDADVDNADVDNGRDNEGGRPQ